MTHKRTVKQGNVFTVDAKVIATNLVLRYLTLHEKRVRVVNSTFNAQASPAISLVSVSVTRPRSWTLIPVTFKTSRNLLTYQRTHLSQFGKNG